mgnify:FL=1
MVRAEDEGGGGRNGGFSPPPPLSYAILRSGFFIKKNSGWLCRLRNEKNILRIVRAKCFIGRMLFYERLGLHCGFVVEITNDFRMNFRELLVF